MVIKANKISKKEIAQKLLKKTISQKQAADFYDSLPPVTVSEMLGLWQGDEFKTGHPLEGLLKLAGWYGKKFDSADEAHALIFRKDNGQLYAINPALIPINLPINKIPKIHRLISAVMKLAKPLISTTKSSARLREIKYLGVVTGAMVYDKIAVIDVFRKVDSNTLMGAMDFKNYPSKKTYYFILYRVK